LKGGAAAVETLKKRSEFLSVRGGARASADAFLMEARGRTQVAKPEIMSEAIRIGTARFGFTVTKKLGNAVTRNRIRRRLREALRLVAPLAARSGCDYVLVARPGALTQPFADLLRDLDSAFQRIHEKLDGGVRKSGRKPRRSTARGRSLSS
jgi:ribonuclease P protein component